MKKLTKKRLLEIISHLVDMSCPPGSKGTCPKGGCDLCWETYIKENVEEIK